MCGVAIRAGSKALSLPHGKNRVRRCTVVGVLCLCLCVLMSSIRILSNWDDFVAYAQYADGAVDSEDRELAD